MTSCMDYESIRVPVADMKRFVLDAFRQCRVRPDIASLTAAGLVSTSVRGVDSHGIRLLPHYVSAVRGGRINPDPAMRFDRSSATTGTLDADHTFGHAAGMTAMREAIALARESGIGMVAVRNSTHCGAMAYYALEACREDMLGLACTHASPKVRTPGSNRPFIGTNPLCFTAPMLNEGPFCFDSAPTPLTSHKVRHHRETGEPLPPGCAADDDGRETTDPHQAEQLLPIGDYKGYGLTMMVDILCGLLTHMPAGRDVSQMYGTELSQRRYLGQFFGAIRIDCFEDPGRFKRRLQAYADQLRSEPRRDPHTPVQVPGDPEKKCAAERIAQGIPMSTTDQERFAALAGMLDINPVMPRELALG